MAQRKISVVGIVFACINIVAALVPPVAGCVGASYFFRPAHHPFRHVDLGPPIRQHFDQAVPAAKFEAVGAFACDSLLGLMLVAGAVGLIVHHEWGRWLTVGTAMLLILTFCAHDVYQFAVVRPEIMPVLVRNLPPGPPGEAEGAQIGFTLVFFFWSWANLFVVVYLFGMAITLAVIGVLPKKASAEPPWRRLDRRRDDDDD